MKKFTKLLSICCLSLLSSVSFAQIQVNSSGGTPTASYTTVSDAFVAINSGVHTGTINMLVNGNTTEPAAPIALAASGQGSANYSSIELKPTVVATISGTTSTGTAVITLDGADNVTINGSIITGSGSRDLTIQNTAATTVAATAAIRLIGRTTLGLGATNCSISNCNIIGNTPGNSGFSGSTVTSSIGIYAGSATAISATGTGADYDNLLIANNSVKNCWIGVLVMGTTTNQCDNVTVRDNVIGSTVATEQVSYRGITLQNVINGLVERNTVSSLIINTSNSNAGIEVYGTATTGSIIRKNKIYDIKSSSASGYGAYGINVTSGTGTEITNNVIHGIATCNYNSVSTTFQAFGIRLAGGTNHKVYYNSINLYGDYTTGSTAKAYSAAFVVTSSTITGIDVRNNVFANKITNSTAAAGEHMAVWFGSGYNFLNANLNNNGYFVSNGTGVHFLGKVGTTSATGLSLDLTAWQAVSQVNNATNDGNSHPIAGNSNAPFTADNNLTIPAATSTPVESGGVAIASLGLPNEDHNQVSRPAGTGTNPDIGAYEFEGSAGGDFFAPDMSNIMASPSTVQCTPTARTITVTATDNVGVTSVALNYSYDGVPQTPVAMTMSGGTALNGTWTGVIPAAPANAITVTYSIQASDAAGNNSSTLSGTEYKDAYLVVTASPDLTINAGGSATISATANDPSLQKVVISEITQYRTGTGQTTTYPAYATGADLAELTNISNIDVDISGWTFQVVGVGARTYNFPASTTIPAGGVLVLHIGTGTDSPSNLYYNMGGTNDAISSSSLSGFIIKNTNNTIIDVVATNGFTAWGATGVQASDWSGALASSSGLAGVIRTGSDSNTAADFSLSGATNVQTIGTFNPGLNSIMVSPNFSWSPGGATTNVVTVGPFATNGAYTYTATYSDGVCSASDDVVITVITPQIPVADFVASPLAGSAGMVVNFTDLSTNLPDTWSWVIAPMNGVTFISGTTATSQNPIVQFDNAGLYTITLTASNSAGFDDSTKVSYIEVDYCASNATNTADTDIGNVTFGNLDNGAATPTLSNPTANAIYTDYTSLSPETYVIDSTYSMSLSQITSGATFYDAQFNAFIDFNNDGMFDPINERVLTGATSSTAPTVTGLVTIPSGSYVGLVAMRIVLTEGGTSSSLPCGTYGYGETEDYLVNLACGTMAPVAMTANICAGTSAVLTTSGNNLVWYDNQTGSSMIVAGDTLITGVLTADTVFYVTATDNGCLESAVSTVNVMILQPSTGVDVISSCGSYTWINGTTYTTSNNTDTYTIVGGSASGCDSILTLNLSIYQATSGTDTQVACNVFTWIDGNTYTASNSSATYTITNGNMNGCDSIVTLNLTINTITGTATMATGILTASPSTGVSYQWVDCNNNNSPITGATAQSYTPTANGNYAVIVTDLNTSCSDMSDCILVNNVSVSELDLFHVSIYPNPSNGVFNIQHEGQLEELTILNVQGAIVYKTTEDVKQIDLTSYENGVYFFNVTVNQSTQIVRVVKQ